jgi:probable phosphoglycerate mutase
MELILIRHGLPLRVENQDGQPADPALSEKGRLQALQMTEWMQRERVDRLYSSPLRRARETAEPLAAAYPSRSSTARPSMTSTRTATFRWNS